MAEPHDETIGDVVDVPRDAKEAPIMQTDAVKENGELPASESLAEIDGKEKGDSRLNSSLPASEVTDIPPAAEDGESAIQSEKAREVGETSKEGIAETALSPDARKAEEEAPKSEEPEKEPPAAEEIPQYGKPQEETGGTEQAEERPVTTEKAPSEEIAGAVGKKEAELEAPKSAETAESEPAARVEEEETTKPVETEQTEEPKTEVAGGGIPELVNTSKTDELETKAGAAEVPKSLETGKKQPVLVGEEETPKPEVKADELAAEETPETNEDEPHISEDNNAPKSSEADVPKATEVVVNKKQEDALESSALIEEPQAEVVSKEEGSTADAGESLPTEEKEALEPKKVEEAEEDSAADAGESLPTEEKEAEEPKKVEEATHEEVPTPHSSVEQEQPATEPEEPTQPKSFWGVVLKHVEPNEKSCLESQPKDEDSTTAPSSNAQDSNDVHKSPEEAHGKEPVASLLDDDTQQEILRRDAAASDVAHEKEGQTGVVEEAPKVVAESETMPKEVSPEALEEVSGRAELSENAATETSEPMEQGNIDDSLKDTESPTSEVEEKQVPENVSEMSKEIPESHSKETAPEPSKRTAGSIEEPKEIPTTINPEQKAVRAGKDTTEQLPQETSNEAKSEEGTSLPVKEAAVQEKESGQDGSALEKQPSLSIYVPKQEEAAAAAERDTPEETTPRGTPLMQRVEHLEQKLAQLQSRQSPRSDFTSTGHSIPRSSIERPIRHTARYVLEETGSKGTLLDRVAALEQKLAYYLNVHLTSPSNGQSTPPITTAAEDLATELDSKPAESQTRDWSPSAAEGDKTPEHVNEETSKAAQDPVKPTTEEKSPEDLSAQNEGVAPSRSTSFKEKKIKAKAAAGKVRGLIAGCFTPKTAKPVSMST